MIIHFKYLEIQICKYLKHSILLSIIIIIFLFCSILPAIFFNAFDQNPKNNVNIEVENYETDHDGLEIKTVLNQNPDYEIATVQFESTGFSATRSNNTPPHIVKPLADITLDEDFGDYILNLIDCAYDNEDPAELLNWYITNENRSLIAVTNENSTDQKIIINSIDNAYGENRIKVWVQDTTGRNDFRELNIKIRPVNDLPTIQKSNLPTMMINPNKLYSIDLTPYITDYDTPLSEVKLAIAKQYQELVKVKKNVLIFNFSGVSDLKIYNITLKLTDDNTKGYYSNINLTINLTNNYPPEVKKRLPDIGLHIGEKLNNIIDLDYYFTDPDHASKSLSFKYLYGENLKITIHNDNNVDIYHENMYPSEELLVFRCIDPMGAFKEQVVRINITIKSNRLMFKPIPDLTTHYNVNYSFNLTPYISSIIDVQKLNFEIYEFIENDWKHYSELKNIDFINVDYPFLKLNYSIIYNNLSIPIYMSMTDGKITKFQEFIIRISSNYPPLLKNSFHSVEFPEDETGRVIFDLYEYFVDIENDNLEFTYIGENVQLIIDTNGLVNFTLSPNWYGTELITIRAMDFEGAITESSFGFTVQPINDAPTITNIPTINLTAGRVSSINYTRYLNDIDNEISELVVTIEGDYVTLAGNYLIFDYPASIEGEQSFKLKVTDGHLSDIQLITVNIESVEQKEINPAEEFPSIILWTVMFLILITIISLVIISIVYINRVRRFRFNEIFLIYKDGVLIAHTNRGAKSSYDSDIIGSMFTAIQDFIQESFSDSNRKLEGSKLKRLDFGNFQIAINRGENIYIAAVFTGFALRNKLLKIERLRKEIEEKYKDVLPTWNGDMTKLKGTQKMIENLLYSTGHKNHIEKVLNTKPDEGKIEDSADLEYESKMIENNEGFK